MPRPKSHPREILLARAMERFWRHGYEATSIDDLVKETGSSRHALYSEFGGKENLFRAALAVYRDAVVSPAFTPVEAPGAGLAEIAAYFEAQIARAESMGLPGPGCLMANTMTERAPHDAAIAHVVGAHSGRLAAGFANALSDVATADRAAALATVLVIFTNGLWSQSRTSAEAGSLRAAVADMIGLLEKKLSP